MEQRLQEAIKLLMEQRLQEAIKLLPSEQQAYIIELTCKGHGLLASAGFEGGMIASFWDDCVRGEILNYLRRKGKDKSEGYHNKMHDFYIDTRCGRAPRKELRQLEDELILEISKDFHPCAICGAPTDKTAQQQHDEQTEGQKKNDEFRNEWQLSKTRLKNRDLTPNSYVCYSCYQDKLAYIPKLCEAKYPDLNYPLHSCRLARGHEGKHWCKFSGENKEWS